MCCKLILLEAPKLPLLEFLDTLFLEAHRSLLAFGIRTGLSPELSTSYKKKEGDRISPIPLLPT